MTTAELADEIGSTDAVTIVNELKEILGETKKMSDEELRTEIQKLADENNISLSDEEVNSLVSLTRQLEKLDTDQLKAKVEEFQSTAKKLAGAKDKISKFAASFGDFMQSVGSFLSGLFK